MNIYFTLCVISCGFFAVPISAQEKLENVPSEDLPTISFYDKAIALERQLKILSSSLEEKDEEMKEMKQMMKEKDDKFIALESRLNTLTSRIEEKDAMLNSHEGQIKLLPSQHQNFTGLSCIETLFIVTATTQGQIPDGYIKFDEKIVDNSDSFNLEYGRLFVPSNGSYLFWFNGEAHNGWLSTVHVLVNGNKRYEFLEQQTCNIDDHCELYHVQNFMFSTYLREGYELWLKNPSSDTLENTNYWPMTFLGCKVA